VTEPKVLFDLEFCFKSGETLYISVEEGRDSIAADEARVKIMLRQSDDAVEEIIVSRSELSYMRTLKRIVRPEARTEDAGALRLVGVSPQVE
jgi:hypothetical protein